MIKRILLFLTIGKDTLQAEQPLKRHLQDRGAFLHMHSGSMAAHELLISFRTLLIPSEAK